MRVETNSVNNTNIASFTGNPGNLYSNLKKSHKVLDKFIDSQENLSHSRFIQDTATNWMPKAIFARSFADFGDMSFLEFLESGIFYFAPPAVGEYLLRRNLFSKILPKNIRADVNKLIPKSLEVLEKSSIKNETLKRTISTKAGIVVGCTVIPASEYALSFAKNLFTLKVFKKSDFNNIANLNKDQKEDAGQQERVRSSAKKHLIKAAVFSAGALGSALTLARFGHQSPLLQKISKTILEPGQVLSNLLHKANIKSPKADEFLKNYLKLDFDEKDGKLALSKGQLALTAISGLFGYSAAAKDRGKLDQKEVWTRVPLVVFYTIFGSSLFDYGYKHYLSKKNKFPDLIKNINGKINIPKKGELPAIAESVSKIKNTPVQQEFERLLKEKAKITAIPYAFSLLFMGFSLAAISRLWTQYRYNQTKKTTDMRAMAPLSPYNMDITQFLSMIKSKNT